MLPILAMTDTGSANSALIARDRAHLIHPLHDLNAHAQGHVWSKAKGRSSPMPTAASASTVWPACGT